MITQICDQGRYLMADLRRWKWDTLRAVFYKIFEQGVWVVIIYRIGRMLFLVDIPIIRIILRFIAYVMFKLSEIVLGVSINPSTDIGPGLYVGHTGALIIHPRAKVGKNLNIGTGVVIGEKGAGKGGYPEIGNDVYLGVGAKILGGIKIGNNVKVGANAVVVRNLPDGVTAAGIPAKIIRKGER